MLKVQHILVLHGPNLNLLGEREPQIYGRQALIEINKRIRATAKANRIAVKILQSNSESKLIDTIHKYRYWANAILINPAAYTHYSYAIRDAISAVSLPAIEVHLSNIKKREPFRKRSVIAPVCIRQISGLGCRSYLEGLTALKRYLRKN